MEKITDEQKAFLDRFIPHIEYLEIYIENYMKNNNFSTVEKDFITTSISAEFLCRLVFSLPDNNANEIRKHVFKETIKDILYRLQLKGINLNLDEE